MGYGNILRNIVDIIIQMRHTRPIMSNLLELHISVEAKRWQANRILYPLWSMVRLCRDNELGTASFVPTQGTRSRTTYVFKAVFNSKEDKASFIQDGIFLVDMYSLNRYSQRGWPKFDDPKDKAAIEQGVALLGVRYWMPKIVYCGKLLTASLFLAGVVLLGLHIYHN